MPIPEGAVEIADLGANEHLYLCPDGHVANYIDPHATNGWGDTWLDNLPAAPQYGEHVIYDYAAGHTAGHNPADNAGAANTAMDAFEANGGIFSSQIDRDGKIWGKKA